MNVIKEETDRLPIKVWASAPEEGCLVQLHNLARLPFAFHHIAAMSDTHQGYGMPIGGVLATKGYIVPNAVGVDIGCGMRAVKTPFSVEQVRPVLHDLLNQIQRDVPTGFNWHKDAQVSPFLDAVELSELPAVVLNELEKAYLQLGTLGGGNHFIEVQSDTEGGVWAMVHSGSRNIGKKVCDYYNGVAEKLNAAYFSTVDVKQELAFLPLSSFEGQEYLTAMNFALGFALENRRLILQAVIAAFGSVGLPFVPQKELDVHHNYAAMEHHFGQNVMVHRKGAVKANGEVVIPGSMGTASYIGQGLENPESFLSCAHGAGRAMGRKEATRQFTCQQVLEDMEGKGIELFKTKKGDVAEECAWAYKDIEDVMACQSDLVTPTVKLTPIGVVKG